MKNPWEYMSAKTSSIKKKSDKNKESEEENVDGSKQDDHPILKIIKVYRLDTEHIYLGLIDIEYMIITINSFVFNVILNRTKN